MHASPPVRIHGRAHSIHCELWLACFSADDLTHVTTRRRRSTMLGEAFYVVTGLLEQAVTGSQSALSKQGPSNHFTSGPPFADHHTAATTSDHTTELAVSATTSSKPTVDAQSTEDADDTPAAFTGISTTVSVPNEVRCRPFTADRLHSNESSDHPPATHPSP